MTRGSTLRLTVALMAGLLPLLWGSGQAQGASAASAASAKGPYVSILFSRSEITAMDGIPCHVDDRGVARTDTVVAPYLASLGIKVTGSVETRPTLTATYWCTHYKETAGASWQAMQQLSQKYGWSFVSHSASYPTTAVWNAMGANQLYAETCGSAQVITAHGLKGANGMFAWPGSRVMANALPLVQRCFDVSRVYGGNGVTSAAQVVTAPYKVSTQGLWGGRCRNTALACSKMQTVLNYVLPSSIIAKLNALQPGQWLSLQPFILVTGKSPAYQTNQTKWDCTSSNPNNHWTNDAERYCYNDFQTIMAAIRQKIVSGRVISADPHTIAAAFGRNV